MCEQEVAEVQGFGFEVGGVGGQDAPVADLAAEELDGSDGGEFAAEAFGVVGGVEYVGEDDPDAVVFARLRAVAQHADDFVADVDGESAEHGTDFGMEGIQGFEDEGKWRGLARTPGWDWFQSGGIGLGHAACHGSIIALGSGQEDGLSFKFTWCRSGFSFGRCAMIQGDVHRP